MRPDALGVAFEAERQALFRVSYRMTGSVADAEDVVQETFVRALERPPRDASRPLGPWLMQVALNVSRDRLKARRRRTYEGPWLPEALETPPGSFDESRHGEARYSELESVTMAFLLTLEELRPLQRAVLLLRDVLDYSVAETARVLAIGENNVKVTHHRAREKMKGYDETRVPLDAERLERTGTALQQFVLALLADDVAAMETVLADDVRTVNDGGGEFYAAYKPIVGRDLVIRFHRKVARQRTAKAYHVIAFVNGLPTLLVRYESAPENVAPRFVTQVEVTAAGRITEIRSLLASAKIAALRFPG